MISQSHTSKKYKKIFKIEAPITDHYFLSKQKGLIYNIWYFTITSEKTLVDQKNDSGNQQHSSSKPIVADQQSCPVVLR
jgi:hypothetical protein